MSDPLTRLRIRPVAAVGGLIGAVLLGVGVGGGVAHVRTAAEPQVQVSEAQPQNNGYQVPASAVVTDNGTSVVYVVVGHFVIRQPVQTAPASSGMVIVTVGLSPHAQVVVSPSNLTDGEKVRLP